MCTPLFERILVALTRLLDVGPARHQTFELIVNHTEDLSQHLGPCSSICADVAAVIQRSAIVRNATPMGGLAWPHAFDHPQASPLFASHCGERTTAAGLPQPARPEPGRALRMPRTLATATSPSATTHPNTLLDRPG